MKNIDLYGLGNGITDVLIEVTDDQFSNLGFEKGSMELLSHEDQQKLLSQFSEKNPSLVSGGSVANSTVLFSQLGGKAAFSCRLADDAYGDHYRGEFEKLGIELSGSVENGGMTGTSLILITPDGERTMRTCLGASASFQADGVSEEFITRAKWIFLEGYLFCSPDFGQKVVDRAIELAKQSDTKIAVTLSDAWVVEEFRNSVEQAVAASDLVFANEREALALTKKDTAEDAASELASRAPHAVVTLSERGSLIASKEFQGQVPTEVVEPVDLTGAGDAFAGSYLSEVIKGKPFGEAAKYANSVAAKVIKQVGARIAL